MEPASVTVEEMLGRAVEWLPLLIGWFNRLIMFLLENSLFRARPDLAESYADAFATLSLLTAFYVFLNLIAAYKRILQDALAAGWSIVLLAAAISAFAPA